MYTRDNYCVRDKENVLVSRLPMYYAKQMDREGSSGYNNMHMQTVTSSYIMCACVRTCDGFAAVAPVGREDGLGLRLLDGEPPSTPAPAAQLPFEFVISCVWLPMPPCSLSDEVTETEGTL